jgi:nicotinamide-nucleotide amidase
MQNYTSRLINFFQKNKLTMAFAESVTCGLAAHKLSQVKDTSQAFKGSIVCYNGEVKTDLLKIPKKLIEKFTPESQQVTDAMAKNLKRLIVADVHAAVTGLASPGGSETKNKPVGTVFFSVLFKKKLFRQRKLYKGTPFQIKTKTCNDLYRMLISSVSKSI